MHVKQVITGRSHISSNSTGKLSEWLARYEPVEREIIEAHERRLANRARRAAERREADTRAFGDLCEATEGFATVWRREGWSVLDMVRWADGDVLTLMTLARWLSIDTARFIDRAQCRLRRPLYYAQEKARRQKQLDERRRVCRRHTSNPCPSREDILDAWTHRHESHDAAIRFGSIIHDLECYVDNSLIRDRNGAIVGRRGGVKAWLQANIPALYVRYTTVMRYKAMAKKLRQVVGLSDPIPAVAVLADETATGIASGKVKASEQDCCTYGIFPGEGWLMSGRSDKVVIEAGKTERLVEKRSRSAIYAPELSVVRARAVWLEVVSGIRENPTALMERLDSLTDPERVEDANMLASWRRKYENEITARMKSKWWRKLTRKKAAG